MTDNTVVPLLFPNNRHANLSTFLVISEQLLKIIFAEVSIPVIIHFTLALSALSTLSEFSCVTACGKEKNMVDMTQILNDILKAIFGKDVRQAIHDGIKRSNDIADDCDTRQTSLERQYDELLKNFSSSSPSAAEVVDARTGLDGTIYETLKKRLDDPRCS